MKLLPVHCKSSEGFKVTLAALESAYSEAQKSNITVKGVLLTNPSNPLGTSMDRETLETVIAFANANRIHLVCDEIFAGTTFAGQEFVGVSEIIQSDPNCDRNLIHIVYSLSKVLGLPGFRVGVVYSYNDEVVACARKMSSFGLVSTQTQHFLASLLADDRFTTEFLAESSRRLAERHRVFINGLSDVGIQCLKGNAGLFCWMDLSSLLKEATPEEELRLWRVIIDEVKLNVSPGSSFQCSEPGWFRVCFANVDDETMAVALGRIRSFMDRAKQARVPAAKKRANWKGSRLRLSFSGRFEEMTIMSPHRMSPRSPLVQAAT